MIRIHAPAIIYFNTVRREGSFRAASRVLNVAASAINRQILKLESEVGAPLFDRLPAGLRLTSAGEALSRHVVALLQDFDRLKDDIEGLSKGVSGSVKLVTIEALCCALLPTAITRLREIAPKVVVSVQVAGSLELAARVVNGDADIAVAFAVPRGPDLLRFSSADFRLGAVVALDHEIAGQGSVTIEECARFPLLLPEPTLGTHLLLQPLLASLDVQAKGTVMANSIELMRELAERGVGISFHTRIGVEQLLQRGRVAFVPLDFHGPVWSDLGVYIRRGRPLSAHHEVVLRILTDAIASSKDVEDQGAADAELATMPCKN